MTLFFNSSCRCLPSLLALAAESRLLRRNNEPSAVCQCHESDSSVSVASFPIRCTVPPRLIDFFWAFVVLKPRFARGGGGEVALGQCFLDSVCDQGASLLIRQVLFGSALRGAWSSKLRSPRQLHVAVRLQGLPASIVE